ncbi:hypothetical protein AAFF_G00293020 [Aldrovandia affinis]|uniref:Uncharacterized protein n=1 Tax=Aldrovandia affinis TaxID=143900 RepID=A0AAD7SR07_9TELE|nr:hypothetical protein AAFF_G00293020 [Aldrovandia affinis]
MAENNGGETQGRERKRALLGLSLRSPTSAAVPQQISAQEVLQGGTAASSWESARVGQRRSRPAGPAAQSYIAHGGTFTGQQINGTALCSPANGF